MVIEEKFLVKLSAKKQVVGTLICHPIGIVLQCLDNWQMLMSLETFSTIIVVLLILHFDHSLIIFFLSTKFGRIQLLDYCMKQLFYFLP